MNSDFMQAEAEQLAKRVAGEPDNRSRIKKAYHLRLRPRPSEQEIKLGIDYLHAEPMREYEENKNKPPEAPRRPSRWSRRWRSPRRSADAAQAGSRCAEADAGRRSARAAPRLAPPPMGMGMMGGMGGCRRVGRRRTPRRRSRGADDRQIRSHRVGAVRSRCCSVPASSCSSTKETLCSTQVSKSAHPARSPAQSRQWFRHDGVRRHAEQSLASAGALSSRTATSASASLDHPQRSQARHLPLHERRLLVTSTASTRSPRSKSTTASRCPAARSRPSAAPAS